MAAGATAAKLAAMGKTVRFLVAADGRFGSESVDTDPETLALRREEEQRASAAVLGVSDVRFLRFIGMNDYTEYEGVKATTDELKAQHSYFINDLEKNVGSDE